MLPEKKKRWKLKRKKHPWKNLKSKTIKQKAHVATKALVSPSNLNSLVWNQTVGPLGTLALAAAFKSDS